MSIAEWAEAFTKAQAEFPSIDKGRTAEIPTKSGGKYSYHYADLTDVLAAVKPVLNANGLSVAQSVTGNSREVAVETRIYHTSGHVEVFGPIVMDAGGDARSAGSGITYARRYALAAALGIAPEEDDDGARATERTQERQEKSKLTREDPPLDPAKWLADAVQVFKRWEEDERRLAYKRAMEQLAIESLAQIEDARRVFDHMTGQYTEEHPVDAAELPF